MRQIDRPFYWLRRFGRSPALWLALPLGLYIWTLGDGFAFDDLHLVLNAEAYQRGERDRLDLFRFAPTPEDAQKLIDRGTLPWWSSREQRSDFLRPLAERLFYLDVLLFGRRAGCHRLVSLLWFAAALWLANRMYQAACGDPGRAGIATAFLGVSQTLAQPVTFISNRADLIVLCAAALAGWAVCSAPRRNAWITAAITGAALIIALSAKEAGIGLAATLVAAGIFMRRRGLDAAGRKSLAPTIAVAAILAVAYLTYYAVTRPWHFQQAASGDSPLLALPALLLKLLVDLSVWWTGFPISALLGRDGWPILVLAGVSLLIGAFVWRHGRTALRGDRAAPFFIIWAAAFLLTALAAARETRSLSIATAGWAYLLSGLLLPPGEGAVLRPSILRHGLLLVNGIAGILCGLAAVAYSARAEHAAVEGLQGCLASLDQPLRDGDTLIALETATPLDWLCAGDRLEFLTQRRDVRAWVLTLPGTQAQAVWEDDRTLLLHGGKRPLLGDPEHRVSLPRRWHARVGERFHMGDIEIQTVEVGDGDVITALRIRLNPAADLKKYRWCGNVESRRRG